MSNEPPHTPCRSPGCEFAGNINWEYYCSQCYKERRGSKGRGGEEEGVPPQAQAANVGGIRGTLGERVKDKLCSQCKQLFGIIEYGGLCEACYTMVVTSDHGTNLPPAAQPDLCMLCRQFYGAPEFGGYCNKCFMDKTKVETMGARGDQSREPDVSFAAPFDRTQRGSTPPAHIPTSFEGTPPSDPPVIPDPSFKVSHTTAPIYGNIPNIGTPPTPKHYENFPYHNPQVGGHQNGPQVPAYRSPPSSSSNPVPAPRRHQTVTHQAVEATDNPLPPHDPTVAGQGDQRRRSATMYEASSCFVCDSQQPIKLSNVVCQQHALMVREMFGRSMSVDVSPPTQGERGVSHTAMHRSRSEGPLTTPDRGRGQNSSNYTAARMPIVEEGTGRPGSGHGHDWGKIPNVGMPGSGQEHSESVPNLGRSGSGRGHDWEHGERISNLGRSGSGRGHDWEHSERIPNVDRSGSGHEYANWEHPNYRSGVGMPGSTSGRGGGSAQNWEQRDWQLPTAVGQQGGWPPQTQQASVPPAANAAVGRVDQARVYEEIEESKPVKMLCRSVGCSFYPIPELNGYCRNCYAGNK